MRSVLLFIHIILQPAVLGNRRYRPCLVRAFRKGYHRKNVTLASPLLPTIFYLGIQNINASVSVLDQHFEKKHQNIIFWYNIKYAFPTAMKISMNINDHQILHFRPMKNICSTKPTQKFKTFGLKIKFRKESKLLNSKLAVLSLGYLSSIILYSLSLEIKKIFLAMNAIYTQRLCTHTYTIA